MSKETEKGCGIGIGLVFGVFIGFFLLTFGCGVIWSFMSSDTENMPEKEAVKDEKRRQSVIEKSTTKEVSDEARTSSGKEFVTGAFGVTFGQKFKSSQILEKEVVGGIPRYKFLPPKPVDIFSEYYVKVTPNDKLLYAIIAKKTFESSTPCMDTYETLKKILKKKYGSGASDWLGNFTIESPGATISVYKDMFCDYLAIEYEDTKLSSQADKERQSKIENSIDESDL